MESDKAIEPVITASLIQDVQELMSLAFIDQNPSICARMFFKSKYRVDYNLIALHDGAKVVAAAFFGIRKIRWFDRVIRALTVGPLAVHPQWQNRGYGGRLLENLNKAAVTHRAELIYLQGTDGYYRKYGFLPIPIKSKVIIKQWTCPETKEIFIRSMNVHDIAAVSSLYELETQDVNFSAVRSIENWEWLLSRAKDTWYFSDPHIIVSSGGVDGYFCVDRSDCNRIREFVVRSNVMSIKNTVAGVLSNFNFDRTRSVEIMTWHSSSLMSALIGEYDAEFRQHLRVNGGQLIKPISNAVSLDCERFSSAEDRRVSSWKIGNSFIFQGDNF